MENTVTISVKEFDELRNTFENSKLKKRLESELIIKKDRILNLEKEIERLIKTDFIEVQSFSYFCSASRYFRKDNTPLWIKKIFN